MIDSSQILVIAATARELGPPNGWHARVCGVGPVDAAAATAAAIAELQPAVVIHVGIAGASPKSGLEPPALVIGSAAYYCDLTVPETWAPRMVAASRDLLAVAQRALPQAVVRLIGTSAAVGGSTAHANTDTDVSAAVMVEAMEGFGVLRAAHLAGVPAIELRAISNCITEPNRTLWRFDDAFAAIIAATEHMVAELRR